MMADLNVWTRMMREVPQETWVWQRRKIPTFLVRFDAVIDGPYVSTCEIDDRPAGSHIARAVNAQFGELFDGVRAGWPEFTGLIAPYRKTDFPESFGTHSLENVPDRGLLWVSSQIGDLDYEPFGPRSVVPVKHIGDKRHLLSLQTGGAARSFRAGDPIDFSRSFVLKPMQGVCCGDVLVNWGEWTDGDGNTVKRPYRPQDSASRSRIERLVEAGREDGREWCMQDFTRPPFLPSQIQEGLCVANPKTPSDLIYLHRVFFGWYGDRFLPLGGVWMARSSKYALIHGTSDALTGAVMLNQRDFEDVITALRK